MRSLSGAENSAASLTVQRREPYAAQQATVAPTIGSVELTVVATGRHTLSTGSGPVSVVTAR